MFFPEAKGSSKVTPRASNLRRLPEDKGRTSLLSACRGSGESLEGVGERTPRVRFE